MYGLVNLNDPGKLLLKSIDIKCTIRNLIAGCSAVITYKNDTNKDTDALLMFPLELGYSVQHVEAHISGKTVLGQYKEIEEAKLINPKNPSIEQKMVVIENEKNDGEVFKFRVGNVPKGSKVKITLIFNMELKLSGTSSQDGRGDSFHLSLPWILKPRKVDQGQADTREVYNINNPFTIDFQATFNGTKDIVALTSAQKNMKINLLADKRNQADMILSKKYDQTKDLDIYIEYEKIKGASVLYDFGAPSTDKDAKDFCKSDVAVIDVIPQFEFKKLELVFLIDKSDAMHGWKRQCASDYLYTFVNRLPKECRFQIYGFGKYFDTAFIRTQDFTESSLESAMRYYNNIDWNFEELNILAPLKKMYKTTPDVDYVRIAFLLIGGNVDNEDEVVQLVKENNGSTILHVIGVGECVSSSFVHRLAAAGLGTPLVVDESDHSNSICGHLLDTSLTLNQLTVLGVDVDCADHVSVTIQHQDQEPVSLDNFLKIYMIIHGLTKEDSVEGKIRVECNGRKETIKVNIHNEHGNNDKDFIAHHLMAKYRIDEMMRKIDKGSVDLKPELIKLSLEAHIAIKYTTLVSMDKQNPNYGLYVSEKMDPLLYYRPMIDPENALAKKKDSSKKDMVNRIPIQIWIRDDVVKCTSGDIVIYIADEQNIDGTWSFEDKLVWRLGLEPNQIKSNQPDLLSLEIWMTTIVFEFLSTKLISRQKEWQRIGKKAKEIITVSIKESGIIEKIQDTSTESDGVTEINLFIRGITRQALSVLDEVETESCIIPLNEIEEVTVEAIAERQKYEIVFVIDRSGSMDGEKIEHARRCVFVFIRSLPENCKFQLYGFGTNFDKAFSSYELYNTNSITIATNYNTKMKADFGGTKLLNPLRDIYNTFVTTDYYRLVFVLTDGQVSDMKEVIDLVRQNNRAHKLFSIGIGSDVSVDLVKGIANAGNGKAAFVQGNSDFNAVVIDLLTKALE